LFQKGAFLLAEDSADVLVASVYVEPRGERAYFGMLAVLPNMQGHGLGRLLVEAAENWARERGCEVMDLTVVNLRTELPPFYGKLGYVESGTAPLHEHMNVTQPAHLIRMSKQL
jgi:GNAT superfamily N-acetyltransferase